MAIVEELATEAAWALGPCGSHGRLIASKPWKNCVFQNVFHDSDTLW